MLGIWYLSLAGCAPVPPGVHRHDPLGRGHQASATGASFHGHACESVDPGLPSTEKICWYGDPETGMKVMVSRQQHAYGQPHGSDERWYEDGSIELRGQYVHGAREGHWERFEPAAAAPGVVLAADPAEKSIAPGLYVEGALFHPIDYQVHGGCGAMFPEEGPVSATGGLSVVRSHRRPTSPAFQLPIGDATQPVDRAPRPEP